MEKINFEDLPSTNTPLNADNVNDLQDNIEKSVNYIGLTQPSTSEKVWLKKGKNLFDKNKVIKQFEFIGGEISPNVDWWISDFISVNENITYFRSGNVTAGKSIYLFNKDKEYITSLNEKLTGAFTIPTNISYIRINGLISELDEDIMIEQGETATTYEPYIEKEILTKNNNGLFEKFYEEEHDTGWVNMSSFVNTTYFSIRENFDPMARRIGNIVYWKGEIYCHTVPSSTVLIYALTNIPNVFQPGYQYSSSGCTFDTNLTYNIFILNDKITISHRNIIATTGEKGYQLTNISGYLID